MAKQRSIFDKIYEQAQNSPVTNQPVTNGGLDIPTGLTEFSKSQYDKPLTSSESILSGEYKYYRGERQPWLDKAANGTIRLAGRALTSGAEGIITPFVGTFYAIKDGKFSSFYDNPVSKTLDEIDKGTKEAFELYNTREAEQATGLSKLKYANTLFGDIFDGIGYSLGAIGTGSAYTKMLSGLGKMAQTGKVGEYLSKLKNIEGAADKLKYIEQINNTYRITDGLKNGTIAFSGALAEASANARSDKNEFKKQMTQEITGGLRDLTDEEEQHIEQLSEQLGNNSFMMNLPTIMMDNWITFGKSVFGNRVTDKLNLKQLGASLERDGLDVYKLAKKSKIDDIIDKTYAIRKFAKPFITEGTQEQLQYAITKGTNDYYSKKYYNPENADFMESVAKGLSEAYGTNEGWDNFLIGALSGGIMGNATNLMNKGSFTNPNKLAEQQILSHINQLPTKEVYKTLIESANTHANIMAEQSKAINEGNDFEYENTKNDDFINYALTRIKTGRVDDLYSDLNSFKTMTPEELKSNFGTDLPVDNVSGIKQTVGQFIESKIKQAQQVDRVSNIINERFPNVSNNIKDRLIYSALTIDNTKERKTKLANEVTNIITNNRHSILSGTQLSAISMNYNMLTTPEAKQMFRDNILESTISPIDQQEILKKVDDIDKLNEREKQFVEEYKELTKPEIQEKLNQLDEEVEKQVNNLDLDKDLEESIKEKIKNRETPDVQFTPEEQQFYENNKESIETNLAEEFKKSQENDLRNQEANIILNDKGEEIDNKVTEDIDTQDVVSIGMTKKYLDSKDLSEDIDNNKQDITVDNIIPDNKTLSQLPNVVMMSLYHHKINDEYGFRFVRDKEGFIEKTNTSISNKVNNPEIANKGSKVYFSIVELDEDNKINNEKNIQNSRKSIEQYIKLGNKFDLYNEEDKLFNSDIYTKSIGIFTEDNTLIGYYQLPHYFHISKNDSNETINKLKESRNTIISTRRLILDKLSKGESVTTTILDKGIGNLLTQIKDNKPVTQGNLLNNLRETDKFNDRAIFVFDNGKGFSLPGSKEIQEEYSEYVNSLNSWNTIGKVYQIVKGANGKNALIPIYSTPINDLTADKIIEAIQSLPTNPNYNQIISRLNDYIYAGNKDRRNNVDLDIKGDGESIKFVINGEEFNLSSIRQGAKINEFKEQLKTKRHNISVNNINNSNYQNDLKEREVLTTNAYTSNGQYFVQPFIQLNPLIQINEAKSATSVDKVILNTPDIINVDDEVQSALNRIKSKGIKLNDDIIDDSAFKRSEDSLINPVDRRKAKEYLNKYFPFLELSDLKTVSEVKGSMIDAIGMLRDTTIYLFEGADNKTLYHEAFHGVFRNLIDQQTQQELLVEAEQHFGKPNREQLDYMIEEIPQAYKDILSKDDLDFIASNKWLEEKLADEFAEHSTTFINKPWYNKILDFFNKILKFFGIVNKTNQSQMQKLFDDMMAKKYTGVTKQIVPFSSLEAFSPSFSRKIGNLSSVTKNARVRQLSSDFAREYFNQLKDGIDPKDINSSVIYSKLIKQYKDILIKESYKDKPDEIIIQVSNSVISNANELAEDVRKSLISNYKIKVPKDFSNIELLNEELSEENEGDEEETNLDGNTSKEHGQDFVNISGIKSASTRLKLALSFIPIRKSNGEVMKDKYGFDQYYPSERVYYWLERNLTGTISLEEQLDRIKKASIFKPELMDVYQMLTVPTGNLEVFEMFRNEFRSNFAKQQMVYLLVTFEKGVETPSYKIINSNREGINREVVDKWLNNLSITNDNNIGELQSDGTIKLHNTKLANKLYKQYKDKQSNITSEELERIIVPFGIEFSEGIVKKILESKDSEQFKKYIDIILDWYSSEDFKNKDKNAREALYKLSEYEITGNINNYTSSFNNVEKKAIYTIQNPSYVSKVVSKIKGKESVFKGFYNEHIQDPFFKYSNLLNELNNNDKFREEQFNVFYLNGLKDSKNESKGAKWTKMTSNDTFSLEATLYQNKTSEQNITSGETAFYSNVTESDKTLHTFIQFKKYSVLFDDNGISPKSEIVDKFYNVVLNEAGRIKQQLKVKEDVKNKLIDKSKLLQYYHYRNNPNSFDGAAYQFNLIDSINSLLPDITQLLSKDFTTNVVDDLKVIKADIKDNIAKELTRVYKNTIKEAISKGVIKVEDKTFKPINLDIKGKDEQETHELIRNFLASFSSNEYLNNIEYSNLINGDPAFYKLNKEGKPSDMPKRFYQGNSMTKSLNKTILPKLKISAIDDVEIPSDESTIRYLKETLGKDFPEIYAEKDGINVTDAQVFVHPDYYKKLLQSSGVWNQDLEKAHKIGEKEITPSSEDDSYRYKIKAIKPFGYGKIYDNDLGIMKPIQIKCSILPLYKSYLENNPLLNDIRDRMQQSGNYMVATKSSLKAALGLRDKFDSNSNTFNNQFEFDLDDFGIQVDNPDHLVDEESSSNRQIKMLIPGNIDTSVEYNGRNGKNIRDEINNLEAANIEDDLKSLNERMLTKEFNEDLKESLTSRGATINQEEVLQVNQYGEFEYPLDFINSTGTENMLSSVFTNKVIKQEFKGGSAVQATALGYKFKSNFKNIEEQQKELTTPDIILPIGTSGSGKSTWVKSINKNNNFIIISPDEMRIEFTGDINDKSKDEEIYKEASNRAIQAIKDGKQIIFDTTNLTRDKRRTFIESIRRKLPNVNIQYKLMPLNPELAKQRIKADIVAGKNRANVSDSTIDRHAESYKQMLEDIKEENIFNYDSIQKLLKLQSDLKWIKANPSNPNNQIDYIECAMPAFTEEFFNKDGSLIDINDIPDEIRNLITYRIPTEGFHSMMSIKVVKFLPPEYGNFILLPYEVTRQFGADFDFDKTYFIRPEFYKTKDGKFKKIEYIDGNSEVNISRRYKKYVSSIINKKKYQDLYKDLIEEFEKYTEYKIESLSRNEKIQALVENNELLTLEEFSKLSIEKQNIKSARNNRIIDNYDVILRDIKTLKYLVKPSGFEAMEDIAKDLGIKTDLLNYYTGNTQRFYKDLFHSIIGLKGQSANHVTGHSFMTMMNLSIPRNNIIRFNYKEYNYLSRLKSDDGNLISEELSSMMAAILDAVKNPDLLPALGINNITIDIWATLVHTGMGIESATYFTASPAIKELSKLFKSNEFQIKSPDFKYKSIDDLISNYMKQIESIKENLNENELNRFNNTLQQELDNQYYALDKKDLKKWIKYDISKDKKGDYTQLEYLVYQVKVLNAYKKIKPTSDSIVKLNKLFSINKEVGPNIENIVDKKYLLDTILNPEFPIIGVGIKSIPQLESYYNTQLDALDTLNKYFPYDSNLYRNIKNKLVSLQYKLGRNLLEISAEDRMKINGFIRMYIDSKSSLFENLDKKRLFTDLPKLIKDIQSPLNDKKYFDGNIRKNPFIEQLKVSFDGNLGYISLRGNRLTDVAKNELIEAFESLFNNPKTKNLMIELIKHSYLSSGFFTGLNSYHSLIPVNIFNELGYKEETIDNQLVITSDFIDFRKTITQKLNNGDILLDSKEVDILLDQLVRNFPKLFTDTYDADSDLFSGFDKESKPKNISIVEENIISSGRSNTLIVGVDEDGNNIYQKYIRIYSKKYKGSLTYRNIKDNKYELINNLGKAGNLIEISSNDIIESIIPKNNYIESKDIVNSFSNKVVEEDVDDNTEVQEVILENNKYKPVIEQENFNVKDIVDERLNPFEDIKNIDEDDLNNAIKICDI